MPVSSAKIRVLSTSSARPSDGRFADVASPPFVSIDDLDVLLGESSIHVVVADVRWYLDGRDAREVFRAGHVPGAVFVDVDVDLAAPHTDASHDVTNGRHPLPSPDDFAAAMNRLGIGDDTWVVAYDDTGGMTAGRLVVMLRMLGRRASLLDGGLNDWIDSHGDDLETGDVEDRDVEIRARHFTARPATVER